MVRESVNMEVCMSNENQLSELIREENSQTARYPVSVPDVAMKINAEMLFGILKKRKNIHNLLNINI